MFNKLRNKIMLILNVYRHICILAIHRFVMSFEDIEKHYISGMVTWNYVPWREMQWPMQLFMN